CGASTLRFISFDVRPTPQYAWAEEAPEDGAPSLGTRLAAPFKVMGGAVGGLFTRRSEAPSPQLAAMLRAADAAAAEAPQGGLRAQRQGVRVAPMPAPVAREPRREPGFAPRTREPAPDEAMEEDGELMPELEMEPP
ncbi:hypothetical protein, partial [Teichococcus deserti]|uniref:hypothetical protein n=1 Tax=Teichococcus deserti TaxID=1817963 RepID=UPI001A959E7F